MATAETSAAPAKAWLKGQDEALVRQITEPIKAAYKPYAFGAFSTPKENIVADALAKKQAVWSRDDKGHVVAAALFSMTKQAAKRTDYAGRLIQIPPGRLFIRHLAAIPGFIDRKVPTIIESLHRQAAGSRSAFPTWIEIHEENEHLKQIVMRLGFRYVATIIQAASDLRGLYQRDDDAAAAAAGALDPAEDPPNAVLMPEIFTREELCLITDELKAYEKKIQGEAWAQHYSSYNRRKSWTAFALRGFQALDPSFIIKPAEMAQSWKDENPQLLENVCADTQAAKYFRGTMDLLRSKCGLQWERLRFMRLSAGGELSRHADITNKDAGLQDGRLCRLHFPIITNDQVTVQGWNPRGKRIDRLFPEGSLCYLDQRKPHRVTNTGKADRIHLVGDAVACASLRDLIRQGGSRP